MIRHCDGTDPNLLQPIYPIGDEPRTEQYRPCACGLTFDDVEYAVVFPHGKLPTAEQKARLFDALGLGYFLDASDLNDESGR